LTEHNAFVRHFRCPEALAAFVVVGELSEEEGYFSFAGATCFGRLAGHRPSPFFGSGRTAPAGNTQSPPYVLQLPFDFSEVIENLQQERYRRPSRDAGRSTAGAAAKFFYYFLRPGLSVAVRKHLQRLRLRGWETIAFPQWPVDNTVETLMDGAMRSLLEGSGASSIPFIWFWPEGARSCVVMTHDVEGPSGRDFCGQLMDLDDSFGIKSSFQLVPDMEGERLGELAAQFRSRGFEVNLHDLNHDGYLFHNRKEFVKRAARINAYARELGCLGFRAGAMYRKQHWYDALDFSYDMSVPNGGHLEAQRGGCCTVMPYFIGRILELPLTTVQDYSLFHILGNYSISLWKEQIELIANRHGLITFITHPDYLIEGRARSVYTDLLTHLDRLRTTNNLWFALPRDVDRWWRHRSRMELTHDGERWCIAGPDSDRARVAHARLVGGRVVYSVERSADRSAPPAPPQAVTR
jgi:hypothetical protein